LLSYPEDNSKLYLLETCDQEIMLLCMHRR
jgi:hypothetical protein